jgi:NAD(P)-dependent dehydrogenase (short-subunit alcohol dehydrogenase family)
MAVAFITGGAGAIGRACAWALVRDGWKVVLADIDEDEVQRVATGFSPQEIAGVYVLDVTDFDAVHSAVVEAAKTNGGLQGLVTVAGGLRGIARSSKAPFIDTAPETWDGIIKVHLNAVFYTCHAILPVFYEGGGGAIVNKRGVRQTLSMFLGAAYIYKLS